MDAKSLGANIQKYRLAQGLTQDATAEKCGLSSNYLRQIELGYKVPRLETFLRIAEVLETPTDLLLSADVNWTSEVRSNELFKRIAHLSTAQQSFILDTVDTLVDGIKTVAHP